jgi:Lrp/AsnC family transcriptional regulator for asnA, asnC and gidA
MQIVAVTDPLELGFARQAMIGIRVRGPLLETADLVAELDEVDYVVVTSGPYDLLVEAVCESDEALLALLSDKIRTIPGVESTETFMYLRLVKQTYSWGVR